MNLDNDSGSDTDARSYVTRAGGLALSSTAAPTTWARRARTRASIGKYPNYTLGGIADMLPDAPGLVIDGLGEITLPIVDEDKAEAIAQIGEQAPFGRGQETLVDTSVRNSWQVNSDKVKVKKPEWDAGLAKASKGIAEGLDLLLYKPGGHFAKHRDTEKEDRMFVTMGGHLVVYKDKEDSAPAKHDFGEAAGAAAQKCHYAVHYADAEHAVTPIISGFRLALTSVTAAAAPAMSLEPDVKRALAELLSQLAQESTCFRYILEHAYTPKSIAELGADALKGRDRGRLAILRAANAAAVALDESGREKDKKEPCKFYLAKQRREVFDDTGGYNERSYRFADWDEVEGPTEHVPHVLDLDGRQVKRGWLAVADRFHNEVLNPDRKMVAQLWHGERSILYGGYLGNEGPTKTVNIPSQRSTDK
ncbi:hypothetical protein OC844_003278 [Tilletia horrida]|nr:hypothetical protein OC844_003278 [Tilletia horrida]